MAASSLLSLIFLFSLCLTASSSSSIAPKPTTITIPLNSPPALFIQNSSSDPFLTIKSLASASLTRAHHLKRPKSNHSLTKSQVFSHSYGGYSISLSFGTPPQTVPFILDTGSSLVWFPCTSRYFCSDCVFPNIDPTKIPTFFPKQSSSSKLLGCRNPKCGWIYGPNTKSRCQDCNPSSQNCNQSCPPYTIQYGSGLTAGLYLSETLDFPQKTIADFLVGCSIISIRQPSGIAGFGRGKESLPSQLGLSKFSYCLLPRRFDDTAKSSDLVLYSGSAGSADKTRGLSYTPFQKNPVTNNSAFSEYYYLTLRKIIVGDKHVKVPYKYLVPGSGTGDGGTIIDSGSTFTFMEGPVFEAVAQEFERQLANYSRATDVEANSGLSPCYNFGSQKKKTGFSPLPELIFQFKGGAKLALPSENYFRPDDTNPNVLCLAILTDNSLGLAGGPAIILGNFQQQNYYVEYDLENERFGFRRQSCK